MAVTKIVAIGGWEMGRPGTQVETEAIDRFIVSLAEKEKPVVAFVPTASGDSRGYIITVYEQYRKRLGCKFKEIMVKEMESDIESVRAKILSSDIVYVGGGNTLKMMKIWRRTGFDKILREAYEAGIVLAGLSAWANCWFEYGHSDSRRFTKPDSPFVFVKWLGLVKGTFCPHYDFEADRRPDLLEKMGKRKGAAYAATNCAALAIIGGKTSVVTSREGAYVAMVEKRDGAVTETVIPE